MIKADIVSKLAGEMNVSRSAATRGLMTIIDSIYKALITGEKVTIVGFGTFFVVHRKGREFKNPRTGKEMKIKARRVPKFSAGSALTAAINDRRT